MKSKTKKIWSVLFLSVVLLVGCGYDESKVGNKTESTRYLQGYSRLYEILEDHETGCKYIKYENSYQGSIAPYYDDSGNVMGCKNNKEKK